jgi:hypothetical protein
MVLVVVPLRHGPQSGATAMECRVAGQRVIPHPDDIKQERDRRPVAKLANLHTWPIRRLIRWIQAAGVSS